MVITALRKQVASLRELTTSEGRDVARRQQGECYRNALLFCEKKDFRAKRSRVSAFGVRAYLSEWSIRSASISNRRLRYNLLSGPIFTTASSAYIIDATRIMRHERLCTSIIINLIINEGVEVCHLSKISMAERCSMELMSCMVVHSSH